MASLPVNMTESKDVERLSADRDDVVEDVIFWVEEQTIESLRGHLSPLKNLAHTSMISSVWSYDEDGDVQLQVDLSSKVLALLDEKFCAQKAKGWWREAQAKWPEVLYGAKYRNFIANRKVDTTGMPNEDFAALMRKRRKALQ